MFLLPILFHGHLGLPLTVVLVAALVVLHAWIWHHRRQRRVPSASGPRGTRGRREARALRESGRSRRIRGARPGTHRIERR